MESRHTPSAAQRERENNEVGFSNGANLSHLIGQDLLRKAGDNPREVNRMALENPSEVADSAQRVASDMLKTMPRTGMSGEPLREVRTPAEIAEQGKALYNQREPQYRGAAQRSADSRRNQIRDLGSGVPDPDSRASKIRAHARDEQDSIFGNMENEAYAMRASAGKDLMAIRLYDDQHLKPGLPVNIGQIRNKLDTLNDDPRAMNIFQNYAKNRDATDDEIRYISSRMK